MDVDAGCVQQDAVHVDSQASFGYLEQFCNHTERVLRQEAEWLEHQEVDLVISDTPSLPLRAAWERGIPRLLISNFTWYDIYSHFPGHARYRKLLDPMRTDYSRATTQILPQCHIQNDYVEHQEETGFLAVTGKEIRNELENHLQWPLTGKTLIFIYLGIAGTASLDWEHLGRMGDFLFLTRDPLPQTVPNLFVLDERFRYTDLIASCDLVCTKAGYSTLATAFAHGKPVLSCSRDHFFEFQAIRRYLESREVGRIINSHRFYTCDWEGDIKKALELNVKGRVPLNGEHKALQIIDHLLSG